MTKPNNPKNIRAATVAAGLRFALVVSRFNSFITDRLLAGALDALEARAAQLEPAPAGEEPKAGD